MAEFNTNLWAPWRMEYIRSLGEEEKEEGCFLCRYWSNPDQDDANRVLFRGENSFVCLNRFPYTNGHLLVACSEHKAKMTDLSAAELSEITGFLRDGTRLLEHVMRCDGFNVGFNIGQCAGAGLPGHIHAHIVPRWNGDTNFMPVLGDTRVMPDALDATWNELAKAAVELGMRS